MPVVAGTDRPVSAASMITAIMATRVITKMRCPAPPRAIASPLWMLRRKVPEQLSVQHFVE